MVRDVFLIAWEAVGYWIFTIAACKQAAMDHFLRIDNQMHPSFILQRWEKEKYEYINIIKMLWSVVLMTSSCYSSNPNF
jgi:hypothetical protein